MELYRILVVATAVLGGVLALVFRSGEPIIRRIVFHLILGIELASIFLNFSGGWEWLLVIFYSLWFVSPIFRPTRKIYDLTCSWQVITVVAISELFIILTG